MQFISIGTVAFFTILIYNVSVGETRTAAATILSSTDYVIHEKRSRLPQNWSRREKLARDFTFRMRIALVQQSLETVEKLLMDVSHPKSPNYSRHMTPAQIADMFAPNHKTISSVTGWLHDFGIKTSDIKTSASKGWLSFKITVADAERLLNTEYHTYEHTSGKLHPATIEYSVPAYVQRHIDFIIPTLHFDVRVSNSPTQQNDIQKRSRRDAASSVGTGLTKMIRLGGLAAHANEGIVGDLSMCNQEITLPCLAALYNFANYEQHSSDDNSYGIVEYTPQFYIKKDMNLFLHQYKRDAEDIQPVVDLIDDLILDTSGPGQFDLNGESNLDLQYAIGLVYPTNVTLYQTGDPIESASFNNFLDALDASYCTFKGGDDPSQDSVYPDSSNNPEAYKGQENCGTYKLANVISTSYGYNEADLTPAYEQRQCMEYGKLGMMGVTVLYSSGDSGVAGNSGCIDPNTGSYTYGPTGIKFTPSFPGTCPYVTSVGATQINPSATIDDPESACEQVIYSGGGFSNVFQMPSYQRDALEEYFEHHNPPYSSTQYNNSRTTRGFPDISANGANYVVAVGGQFYLVYGTSASAPVVGSIVTLINDARLTIGKRPVGFINPVIYTFPFVLNDITSGNNPGCGTNGFSAVPGWDPVTGLGTPNFEKLKWLYLFLP